MVAIPLPVSTVPGFRSQESAGRLINCYAEPIGEGTKDAGPPQKRVRVPGMTSFLTSAGTVFRGMGLLAGAKPLYVAMSTGLFKAGAGDTTLFTHGGSFTPTSSVYFARNNAPSPHKIMVSGNQAFEITDISPFIATYTGGGVLPGPNGVCSIDGYIVFTVGNGQFYATDLNALTMNAFSYGTAEVSPDAPSRPISFMGRLLIFGTTTMEVWIDVGSTPFPFQRTTSVPVGLIGPDAVAGWEDGWGSGLMWVANDFTVRNLDGYTATRISTPDLERLIQRDTNKALMLASVHVVDGHPMWTVTGQTFTWTYDVSTKQWHERASNLTNRWRGLQSVNAFGQWLVGDRGDYSPTQSSILGVPSYTPDGTIFAIDPTNFTEGGDPLVMRVESAPVIQFPQRVRVGRADFQIEVGVGNALGSGPQIDPTAIISWSDDGGINWSVPIYRSMGRQSNYKNISLYRTGMSTRLGRRWRIDIADPVYAAIFAGDQAAELRKEGTAS